MFRALESTGERTAVTPHSVTGTLASATLSLITTPQALRDLEVKWRSLEANTQSNANVFQSYDWVTAWTETFVSQESGVSLHIIAGYDSDELVFLWPLMRTRRFGFAVLTWLTDPFGQYGDVLCRKGQCPKLWMESAMSFLNRLKDIDILHLRHVRDDSQLGTQAANLLIDARVPEGAPFLDLTQFADEGEYEARYNSVQRRRRKKIRKALEEMGPMTFARLSVGSLSDAAMKHAIDEKNIWLSERGRFNRVLGSPSHLVFLKNLSRRLHGTIEVVVTEIKAGNTPVSWEISFRHKGTHFGYITSHINRLTNLSPGRLHMDLSQRACLADGVKVFDLMVPNDTHKESWSSGMATTNDYYLPLSWAGAAYGHVYIRTLRPLMRAAYYKMDAASRRKYNIFNMFKAKPKAREDH